MDKFEVNPYGKMGVMIIKHPVFNDERGYFEPLYQEGIIKDKFIEENVSFSQHGVLRGLHLQLHKPQAKFVTCLKGCIQDVWVDLRKDSKTFGQWQAVKLQGTSGLSVYIPAGFAHGFEVLSTFALVHYKVSQKHDPESQSGISWNDPAVGILWQNSMPILSERDKALPSLERVKGLIE